MIEKGANKILRVINDALAEAEAFDMVVNQPVKRFCPLINGECRRHECMWYLSNGRCAIAVMAVRLDDLTAGVPVIRLFPECDKDE